MITGLREIKYKVVSISKSNLKNDYSLFTIRLVTVVYDTIQLIQCL